MLPSLRSLFLHNFFASSLMPFLRKTTFKFHASYFADLLLLLFRTFLHTFWLGSYYPTWMFSCLVSCQFNCINVCLVLRYLWANSFLHTFLHRFLLRFWIGFLPCFLLHIVIHLRSFLWLISHTFWPCSLLSFALFCHLLLFIFCVVLSTISVLLPA